MKRFIVLALALCPPAAGQTWTRAHGGADGAGFADVSTAPAMQANAMAAVGPLAPGVGPVIGPNGDAYLGTTDGRLLAIMENGTKRWGRPLLAGTKVFASPLVGSDGSIYVASSMELGAPDAHDRRTVRSWLYKFDAGGNQRWVRPLPVVGKTSGAVLALNATGTGAGETIFVAAMDVTAIKVITTSLTGFRQNGTQLFAQSAGGSSDGPPMDNVHESTLHCIFDMACWFGMKEFRPETLPDSAPDTTLPPDRALTKDAHTTPVGIAVAPDGSIMIADGYRATRGYRQTGTSLTPIFEKKDERYLSSSLAALPNLSSMYAVYPGRIAFGGPSTEKVADLWQSTDHHEIPVEASPTRLADGRVVTIDRDGRLTIVDDVTPTTAVKLNSQTMTAASASRTLFYVSTVNELTTFDSATVSPVAHFAWTGGGQSSPAIGKDGAVYATAGDTLFIFKNTLNVSGNVRDHRGEHRLGISPPSNVRDHRSH